MFWLLITIFILNLFSFNFVFFVLFSSPFPPLFPLPQSWFVIENGLPLYLWPRKAGLEVNVIYCW